MYNEECENELIMNKWKNTVYNVLGKQRTTQVFLISRLCIMSAIALLSHPGLSNMLILVLIFISFSNQYKVIDGPEAFNEY